MNRKGARVEILRQIREGKDVLFGCFSKTLTKKMKNEKWREIHNKAQALGLVPYDKDYTYSRDTLWQNMRKNSMKKFDNARSTGSGGGPEFKLTEIDILVSDIIGKDSAVMSGLPVPDTWGNTTPDTPTTEEREDDVDDPVAAINQTQADRMDNRRNVKRKVTKKEEEEELKLKKLKMSLEIMEMEKYELTLKTLKLEQALSLPPSKYTQSFQSCHVIHVENESLETNTAEMSSLDSE